jgi:hypothetical protein
MPCSNIITALVPSCATLIKKGGYDKRFWIGSIADLSSITFGTNQEITALAFTSPYGFKTYSGKRFKNNAAHSITAGENFNERVQSFNAVLFAETAAERKSIEQLIDAQDVFVVSESNNGKLEVFGINKGANSQYDGYGLKVTAAEQAIGALLNDDTAIMLTFSGTFENWALVYAEGTALDTNIAAIEAMVV